MTDALVSQPQDPASEPPGTAVPDPGDGEGILPEVEKALQEACGALLALEAGVMFVDRIPGEHPPIEAALQSAIDSVRTAIEALRELLPRSQASALAFGFVTRRRRGPGGEVS